MRNLDLNESRMVSGAAYGICEMDDYMPNYVTVDTSAQTDPILMAMNALSAAAWGCAGGAVMGGGAIGCAIGGFIGVGSTVMSAAINDAYKMYLDAQRK